VLDRCHTCPLSGVVKSSQLGLPQREVPVAPFHIGAGALAYLGELGRLLLQPTLLERMQLTARPTRCTPGCTEAIRTLPPWCTFPDQLGGSDTFEIVRGHAMRRHGVGRWRRQGPLTAVLPPRARDALAGGLPVGDHALGFRATLQAGRAAVFLLGHGAERIDVALDIPGNALPVATHAALHVDTVGGVTKGAEALGDHLALPNEALVLVARGCHILRHLLQTRCRLWRTTWTTLCRRAGGVVEVLLPPLERLFGLRHGLCSSPLCGGHRRRDRLAECMLHRA